MLGQLTQCCPPPPRVRDILHMQAAALGPAPRSASRLRSFIAAWRRPSRHSSLVASSPLGPSPPAGNSPTAAALRQPGDSLAIQVEQAGQAGAAGADVSSGEGSSKGSGSTSNGWAKLRSTLDRPNGLALLQAAAGAGGATVGSQLRPREQAHPSRPSPLPREPSINAATTSSADVNVLAPIASLELEGRVLPEVVTAPSQAAGAAEAGGARGAPSGGPTQRRLLAR